MELYLLRTFVTVAEQGHLTKAATLLHVTQPAVSGQVKALEESVGLKLFERSPTGVRLTKAGEALLPKAKAIEDAIRGGVRRVHVMSYKSPEGILAEVFTNEGAGTLIVADVNALSPAEQLVGK